MDAAIGVTTRSPEWSIRFDAPARIKAVAVSLAFATVFYPVLLDLWYAWTHSADWSHGPIIPLFSAYLLYINWEQVRRCPIRHTWVGLVLILAGVLLYQYSLWGLVIGYLRPLSMLVSLLGVLIFLCGLPVLRWGIVPWLFLFFAVPLPKGIYFMLTNPLREIAAVVATNVLMLLPNLDISQVGSTIEYFYNGRTGALGVADACSGMRSTITLCALGVAVAFMARRPAWHRAIMIASCVPIAVFSNFIRVTVTCILHIYVGAKYAEGTYHTLLGLVTLLIAFGIFSGLGWLLNNLFEPVDEHEPLAQPPAAGERG